MELGEIVDVLTLLVIEKFTGSEIDVRYFGYVTGLRIRGMRDTGNVSAWMFA